MTQLDALTQRAKQSLFNQSEVTTEALETALAEALELTDSKPIPQVMLMDLAMFRLMISLKAIPSDMDERLANMAIKRAQNTKDPVVQNVAPKPAAYYGDRVSEWI